MESLELLKILEGMKMLQGSITALKEKMNIPTSFTSSIETTELDNAFAKAQAKFLIPEKDKTGNRGHQYSSVEALLKAVLPALNEYGISLKQPIVQEEEEFYLITRIKHNGQFEQSKILLVVDDKQPNGFNQTLGSSITYQRRYALSSFLGIGGADDNDPDAVDARNVPKTEPQNQRLEHIAKEQPKQAQSTFTPNRTHPIER